MDIDDARAEAMLLKLLATSMALELGCACVPAFEEKGVAPGELLRLRMLPMELEPRQADISTGTD